MNGLRWEETGPGSWDGFSGEARIATVRATQAGCVIYCNRASGGVYSGASETPRGAMADADDAWLRSLEVAGLRSRADAALEALTLMGELDELEADRARLRRRIRAAESVLRGARLTANEAAE